MPTGEKKDDEIKFEKLGVQFPLFVETIKKTGKQEK